MAKKQLVAAGAGALLLAGVAANDANAENRIFGVDIPDDLSGHTQVVNAVADYKSYLQKQGIDLGLMSDECELAESDTMYTVCDNLRAVVDTVIHKKEMGELEQGLMQDDKEIAELAQKKQEVDKKGTELAQDIENGEANNVEVAQDIKDGENKNNETEKRNKEKDKVIATLEKHLASL